MATGPAGYPPIWMFTLGEFLALISTAFIVVILIVLALTREGRHKQEDLTPMGFIYWSMIVSALGTCFLLAFFLIPYPGIFWAEWVSFVLQVASAPLLVVGIIRLFVEPSTDDGNESPKDSALSKAA